MKIDRPLNNPEVDEENNLEEERVEESPDQLYFDINTPRDSLVQSINSFKMLFEKRNELLEISILWRSPALPFAIVSTIFNLILLGGGTILQFNNIPPQVPLFYNAIDKRWEQVDKSIIFLVFFFLLIIENVIIYLITQTFKNDKRLALIVSWIVFLLNLLILIAIVQIYSLVV